MKIVNGEYKILTDLSEGPNKYETLAVTFTVDRGAIHDFMEAFVECTFEDDTFEGEIEIINIMGCFKLDRSIGSIPKATSMKIFDEWMAAMRDAEKHYNQMLAYGASKQLSRSVLPQSTKVEITVRGTYLDWKHFFDVHTTQEAYPQMKQVAIPLLQELQKKTSGIFIDVAL